MKEIVSTCIYCGMGCRLKYIVDKDKLIKVLPCPEDSVSNGKPCIKGLSIHEVVDEGRIRKPMINKNGKLKEISWERAIDEIYKMMKSFSPDETFITASGKITNEDNYVIQKFVRSVLGTNNVDSCCTRLCHAPTVAASEDCFGISCCPDYTSEMKDVDVLLVVGTNPASNYPVLFNKMMEKKRKIIAVVPLFSETAEYADIVVKLFPGTEIAFLNCIANIIAADLKEIPGQGAEEYRRVIEKYDVKSVAKICKISEKTINEVASMIKSSKSFGVMHGMGLTQHTTGVANVHSLFNLAILKRGKIFSARGEINVQGVGDMFASPNTLMLSKISERIKRFWKIDVPEERGMNIIEALCLDVPKLCVVSGFNPAHSMPDLNNIHKNLRKTFLVQADSYFNLTSRFAKLILPTPLLIERDGTITNYERLVRRVTRIREPIGLPEWKIYSMLAERFGARGFNYKNELDIFKEIIKVIPDYEGLNAEKIYSGIDEYAKKERKIERYMPEEFKGTEEMRSEQYPLILFTFRSRFQFLSSEATSKAKSLRQMYENKPHFHVSIEDAKRMKIKEWDYIKVTSKVSSITGPARLDKRIPSGFVGAHFHSEKLLVNKLFPLCFDTRCFTPNLKLVAVRVEKI